MTWVAAAGSSGPGRAHPPRTARDPGRARLPDGLENIGRVLPRRGFRPSGRAYTNRVAGRNNWC